jgi:hypothetical protein
VSGLQRCRCDARETDAVKPVPDHVVDATVPYLSPTVRAMVDLQPLTGMRPGELCMLRLLVREGRIMPSQSESASDARENQDEAV